MSDIIYVHNGAMGDIIYSIPTVIAKGAGIYYITKEPMVIFLSPLLEVQKCIVQVKLGVPDVPYINLCAYRKVAISAIQQKVSKHLADSHLEAVGAKFDISQRWLENVEPKSIFPIVVSRSLRYWGRLDWSPLKSMEKEIGFIGLKREFRWFVSETGINPGYIKVTNALEMAQAISGSKLFIGNQSLAFAIAEALKHPRVLEVCPGIENCGPIGSHGFIKITEEILSEYTII